MPEVMALLTAACVPLNATSGPPDCVTALLLSCPTVYARALTSIRWRCYRPAVGVSHRACIDSSEILMRGVRPFMHRRATFAG